MTIRELIKALLDLNTNLDLDIVVYPEEHPGGLNIAYAETDPYGMPSIVLDVAD